MMRLRVGKSADLVVLFAVWLGLCVLFGQMSAGFLNSATLGSMANRIPALMLTATGMTLLMMTGGIDISASSSLYSRDAACQGLQIGQRLKK